MPRPALLESIHLTAFKSFAGAELGLDDLTLLVGRNGAGKSNALDAVWVLSRLAHGLPLHEAIDPSAEMAAVRGGARGCLPFGREAFELGCTVRAGGHSYRLDLTVRVLPQLQIEAERLTVAGDQVLYETEAAAAGLADLQVRWNNRRQGPNPRVAFRSDALIAHQVPARIPGDSEAGRAIHAACEAITTALGAVFVLDPVPHRMRGYVPRHDTRLRRDGANLSAVVAELAADRTATERLAELLGVVSGAPVSALETSESDLGDVILRVMEAAEPQPRPVSARLLSDGTLRFLAIVVALFRPPGPPAAGADRRWSGVPLLVVEELENGLHASQSATLLAEIRAQVADGHVRVLATGHSPALLDALSGDEHRGVQVVQREATAAGHSTITPLTELDNYFRIVAGGTVGSAAVADRLRRSAARPSRLLDLLLDGPHD